MKITNINNAEVQWLLSGSRCSNALSFSLKITPQQSIQLKPKNTDWLQKPNIIHGFGFEGGKTVASFWKLCLLWASQTLKQHRRKVSQQSMSRNMDLRMMLNFTLLHSHSEKLWYIFSLELFYLLVTYDTLLTARCMVKVRGWKKK
jgi:hypothetical protein